VVAVRTAIVRFGAGHLAVLAGAAALAALAAVLGRRLRGHPAAAKAARALAYPIVAALLLDPVTHYAHGELTLGKALPLQLCDLAALACACALWKGRQLAFELAYFWGLAGATQALLTPPPGPGLEDPDTWRYAVVHAATIAGVFYLGPGLGLRPRRGAWRRVSLVTAGYAVAVGLFDWALGANYMWLREKPAGSVLDLLGPWPWYILGGGAIGVLLFYLLDLPYRRPGRTGPPTSRRAP